MDVELLVGSPEWALTANSSGAFYFLNQANILVARMKGEAAPTFVVPEPSVENTPTSAQFSPTNQPSITVSQETNPVSTQVFSQGDVSQGIASQAVSSQS